MLKHSSTLHLLLATVLLAAGQAAWSQPASGTLDTDTGCPLVRMSIEHLPDLNLPRASHIVFMAGDEVVVVGGHTTGFVLTPTAEYLRDGRWHLIDTPYPHDYALSVPLRAGRVLVAGGMEQDLGIGQRFSAEFFDPATHSFTDYGCLDCKRSFASAIELNAGRVAISGNWYNKDGTEIYDGMGHFGTARPTRVERACPYMFKISPTDALIFSRLDTHGQFMDSIVVETLGGQVVDVPLLRTWHPLQVRPNMFRSDDSFIGDTAQGSYAYLLPVEDSLGRVAVARVDSTRFSLLPTTHPVPCQTPWGPIFYTAAHFVADRAAGRAYLTGQVANRLVVLCVDYARAHTGQAAPVSLYYTDPLPVIGDAVMPVLTPAGNLLMAGGMSPDNYNPTASVLLLRVSEKADAAFATNKLGLRWLWPVALAVAALLFIYVRARRKRLGMLSEADAALTEADAVQAGNDAVQTETNTPSPESLALMDRITRLMEGERPYLIPDLKVSDVASQLHVTPRRVSESINAVCGCTFSQLISTYRIRHAQQLLTDDPDKKITVVCTESGFASETTFFRTFKALTGMTPTEWLQQTRL